MLAIQSHWPIFTDGLPNNAVRAYRLPESNLTVVYVGSQTIPPSVGVSFADPDADDGQEWAKAFSNAIDNARNTHTGKPPSAMHMPQAVTLSDREHRILVLLCEGMNTKTIAATLGVSINTVGNNMKRIKQKVGAKSIEQAIYRLAPVLLPLDPVPIRLVSADAAIADG